MLETVNFRFSDEVSALVGLRRKQVFVEDACDLQGLRNLLGMLYPDLMPFAEYLIVERQTGDCSGEPHEDAIAVSVSLRQMNTV